MFWDPLNAKITILAFKLCVCVSVISITQKQIPAKASSLELFICIKYRCYLKLFIKLVKKTLLTGAHKRIITHKGLWRKFLVIEFLFI